MNGIAVHQNELSGRRDLSDRFRHGFPGGAEDVDLIDAFGGDFSDGPFDGRFGEQLGAELFPSGFRKLFGIVQTGGDPGVIGEDDSGSDDGTG